MPMDPYMYKQVDLMDRTKAVQASVALLAQLKMVCSVGEVHM